MKKILYSLLFLLFFVSCSSSEGEVQETTPTNSNIIGSWKLTSFTETQVSESTVNGQFTSETSETLGQDFTLKYIFSENPKEITSTGTYTGFTRLENGAIVQSNFNAITGINNGSSWNLNNNTITLSNPDFNQNISIQSFDGTNLVLRFTHMVEDEDVIAGNTFKWTFTSDLTLKKE